MNRPPAFQFYPKDWLDFRVQRMSLAAQGAYIKILCFMWSDSEDQCSIVDDDRLIATSLGLTTVEQWLPSVEQWLLLRTEIQHEIDPIFEQKDGRLYSKRLRQEAEKQTLYRKSQSNKGKWDRTTVEQRLNNGLTGGQPKPNSLSSSSSSKIYLKKDILRKPFPNDFAVSDAVRSLAKSKAWPDPDSEFESFRDYHVAKGSRFCDWEAALRTWLRNGKKFTEEKNPKSFVYKPPREMPD